MSEEILKDTQALRHELVSQLHKGPISIDVYRIIHQKWSGLKERLEIEERSKKFYEKWMPFNNFALIHKEFGYIDNKLHPTKFPFSITPDSDAKNYLSILCIDDMVNFGLVNQECYATSRIAIHQKIYELSSTGCVIDQSGTCYNYLVTLSTVLKTYKLAKLLPNNTSFEESINYLKALPLELLFDDIFSARARNVNQGFTNYHHGYELWSSSRVFFDTMLFHTVDIKDKIQDMPERYRDILINRYVVGGTNMLIDALLTAGADPNVVNNNDKDAMHFMIRRNYVRLVNKLFSCGYKLRELEYNGNHLFYAYALYCNDKSDSMFKIIEILISKGANCYARISDNELFLHRVLQDNRREIFDLFIKYQINLNHLTYNGSTIVQLICEKRLSPSYINVYFKQCDDRKWNSDIFFCKDQEVRVSITDTIHYCARNGLYDYLECICDTRSHTLYAILTAIASLDDPNLNEFERVLDASIDVANMLDDENISKHVLHIAAEKGHQRICKMLLNRRVNVNIKDRDGCQPLHYAVKFGHFELCEYLIRKNAEINTPGLNGLTPILFAFKSNLDTHSYLNIIDLLISNGAETDIKVLSTHFRKQ